MVADCKLPTRCLRCRGFGHLAKNCKRPRLLRDGRGGGPQPRHSVRTRRDSHSPSTPRSPSTPPTRRVPWVRRCGSPHGGGATGIKCAPELEAFIHWTDRAVIADCFACDPMLIEVSCRETCHPRGFSAPASPSLFGGTNPTSIDPPSTPTGGAVAAVAPVLTVGDLCNPATVEPPALPCLSTPVAACCAVSEANPGTQDRLNAFIGEIQMCIPTPLLAQLPKPKTNADPRPATRASARIAKSKLARVPISKRGEILLMQRLDLAADDSSSIFRASLTCSHAAKIQGAFPARKLASSRSGASVTTT
ncbi:hypothetical protein C2845_PM11G17560 [Panicum miliaceum]|uniref:CCHC-type domain-containing protein n=1 Tax=Panicum miliaceum TaxID=4540 RepID=A0A3L6RQK5_PANMI|nr:hypothetical protein C2845_PM11G17560 [Panicum miliaceum]